MFGLFNRKESFPIKKYSGVNLWVDRDSIEKGAGKSSVEASLSHVIQKTIDKNRIYYIALSIDGYNNDPRELYEVPEVQQWAARIWRECPEFIWWLTPVSKIRFCAWLFPPKDKSEELSPIYQDKLKIKFASDILTEAMACAEKRLARIGLPEGIVVALRREVLSMDPRAFSVREICVSEE